VNHPADCGPCDDCLEFAEESGYNLVRLGGPETTPETLRKIRAAHRRQEVLALRAEGLVVGAIADRLGISDKTVRNHLSEARQTQ
jgi:DNA-binding NarL/FixJ family response regulator